MPMTSPGREEGPHWAVDIPIRTRAGGFGTHTFVIRAVSPAAAVDAAWDRAHTKDAVHRRKGAALAAQRTHLTAHMVPRGLY